MTLTPFGYIRKNWIELLVAVIWLQSVIGAVIAENWTLLAIAGLGGLLLLTIIFIVLQKQQRHPIGTGEGFKIPRKALIFTIGRQKETVNLSIQNQKPEWLGLICTYQSESVANEIISESGLLPEHCQKEIVDPWDILDGRDKVEVLIQWLQRKGLQPEDIVVDLTGGTTPMSVGAFSITDVMGIDTQYIRSRYDENNRPILDSQDCILVSRHTRRLKQAEEPKEGKSTT